MLKPYYIEPLMRNKMAIAFERTEAPGSYAGFEYQFLVFLKAILSLRVGETAGFENKDDVHRITSSGHTILIQTKHTIQKAVSGSSINLTNLDPELWKSVTNWLSLFFKPTFTEYSKADFAESRPDVTLDTIFDKYSFVLVTNKGITKNAHYLTLFSDADIISKRLILGNLQKSTDNSEIKAQIAYLNSLKDEDFQSFSSRVTIANDSIDIIDQIENTLREKYVPSGRIESLLASIYKRIKDYTYEKIGEGESVEIDFDTQSALLGRYFEFARSKFNPQHRRLVPPSLLEQNPSDRVFIKQLRDINCITAVRLISESLKT